jgi:hypothetical protein
MLQGRDLTCREDVNIILGTAEKRECNEKKMCRTDLRALWSAKPPWRGLPWQMMVLAVGLVVHSGLLESHTALEEQVVEGKKFTLVLVRERSRRARVMDRQP